MEHRKIQKTGGSTFTISLPNKWVKKQGLHKGSEIGIIELDNNDLVLRSDTAKEPKKIELNITPDMDIGFIIRLLITRYIQGHDTIHIISSEHIHSDIKKRIKDTIHLLIGLELFGDSDKALTFNVLLRQDIQIADTLYQMCDVSISSFNDLEEYMKNRDPDLVTGIIQRDDEVDKFYFLVLRQLSTMTGFVKTGWMTIASSVEGVADHIENIIELYSQIDDKTIKKNKQLMQSYSKLSGLYMDVIDALKSENPAGANEIANKAELFQQNTKKQLNNLLAKKIDPSVVLIYDSFGRIGEHISDIGEAIVNLS